ncbi:hypothetical protein CJF40_23340 [Pseudomonas lundensis]|uniref:hypothetical protein n=2 Tax=Pseudomonas lundensis TaxID=86185 RepID=UPI000BA2A8B9|nr:hypothetical protein [Pseudomonas lundensis]OZY25802.1 hypothetical protein CJF40_23340 [Pseudomonas lundensis]
MPHPIIANARQHAHAPDHLQVKCFTIVPSPDEIARLRAEVANLEARGGKATLTVCGDKKRLCAEIDTRAPEYGERGQFRILKGY